MLTSTAHARNSSMLICLSPSISPHLRQSYIASPFSTSYRPFLISVSESLPLPSLSSFLKTSRRYYTYYGKTISATYLKALLSFSVCTSVLLIDFCSNKLTFLVPQQFALCIEYALKIVYVWIFLSG